MAARAANARRTPALRPCAGRGRARMTFEEARAQFPVFERFAYLNAGSNGPLARTTVDAVVRQIALDRDAGRSGSPWLDEYLERGARARRVIAAVIDGEPLLIALTDSTTR